MRWSIRKQIITPLVALAIVSLSAVGVVNALLAERRTSSAVEQQLRNVVGVLNTSSFPLTNKVLEQMRDLSSADYVLLDDAGDTTASTLNVHTKLPTEPMVSRLQDVQLGSTAEIDGRWYFHTAVKLPIGVEGSRSGMLHVLFPQDEYRRAWQQAFVPSFIVGAITSLVLAAVAWAIANRMSGSISRLRGEVLRIAHGDFRAAELPTVDDEIRELSAAVNRTAQMLAEYEQQVRQSEQMRTLTVLGASIAHQLRNAATGCRMALDLHAAECNATDNGECLDVAKRQLRLMESQLQRFLRIGKRPAEIAKREIELGALIEELLPLARPAAEHAGVTLKSQLDDGLIKVLGDEEALSQVVLNLLLNAIEAAKQHALESGVPGIVTIELSAKGERIELVVSDSGAGPAESLAASVFEPFVTSKTEGAGLGLAVAREIVVAHGGAISWNREHGRTRFCVELPLLKSEFARV